MLARQQQALFNVSLTVFTSLMTSKSFSPDYRTHLISIQEEARRLSINLIKQRFSFALALPKVLSKFLTKLLHLSTQAFDLSIIQRVATGTNPDFPSCCFSSLDGLGDTTLREASYKLDFSHYLWINLF